MFANDTDNPEFKLAYDFVTNTNHPVFLTGKAGTGKTTFLKNIQASVIKSMAIVAPTGVAAMNAGGTTIHSFFQLPFTPFIGVKKQTDTDKKEVNDRNTLLNQLKLTAERKEILQQLDLLIIDEISMVRADLLDAIDVVLRYVRNNYTQPFGGVQLLYIGDMYQLPPVVKQDEWHLLHTVYDSPFFFNSHVIKEQPPVYIELNKVYRQKDKNFIHLLNQVRNNEMDEEGYELLHSRYVAHDKDNPEKEGIIVLTTHNAKADAINNQAIHRIAEEPHFFKATIGGIFQENSFPTDENLLLKKGAQVMFVKNDTEKVRRYFNGKIGRVQSVETDKIWIECIEGERTNVIELKKETWRNIKYTINAKSGKIEEEELGSFTQFPLRLAWAITIHKSQGLTFEKVVIDAGQSFAPGQVYVALSRCTTLEGLHLITKISMSSLQSDPRIVAFAQDQKSRAKNLQLLESSARESEFLLLSSIFDFSKLDKSFLDLTNFARGNGFQPVVSEWVMGCKDEWKKMYSHSVNFCLQLKSYTDTVHLDSSIFKKRIKAGSTYFVDQLELLITYLDKCPAKTDNKQISKIFDDLFHQIRKQLLLKIHFMKGCEQEASTGNFYKQKNSFVKDKASFSAYSGRSALLPENLAHPELYSLLKRKRDQICSDHNLPIYLVCNSASLEQMATFLPITLQSLEKISGFGKIKVAQYGKHFVAIIADYCETNNIEPSDTFTPIKLQRKALSSLKEDTKKLSFEKFTNGKSIVEIAAERNLSPSTIEGHLAHFVKEGQLNIEKLVQAGTIETIRRAREKAAHETISGLKSLLPDVSYADLKFYMASEKINNV